MSLVLQAKVFKLSIEAMQVWQDFYWDLMLKLDKSSTQAVSVKNYEIRFSRSDYTHIHEYLCSVSFLTTLDIYKNHFKSHHKWCKVLQKNNTCILWSEAEITLVYYFLCRNYCVFIPMVLWQRGFLVIIVDELKNFATHNLPQVSMLVTYYNPSIIG